MEIFLEQVADAILNINPNNSLRTAVIFPNKRSEIFLKNILSTKVNTTIWLPDFFTIDEFITQASGLFAMDPVTVYFELYDIHKKVAGKDSRSVEDFLSWAPMMLGDFNDIDLNLVDASQVFRHLSEAKAMSAWNLDRKPLTELQKNYLAFYNALIEYYQQLQLSLSSKNAGYKGMIYRNLAENMEGQCKSLKWERFLFVGFNALTPAEKQIFSYLKDHYKVDFFWDVDEWYMKPDAYGLAESEAGRFIRGLITELGIEVPIWPKSRLIHHEKKIQLLGVSKNIGQLKYVSQQVRAWQAAGDHRIHDTAIVLADETLLIPLLNSLDEKDADQQALTYNVSMGYPLTGSPLSQFVIQWMDFILKTHEQPHKKYALMHLEALLNHTILRFAIDYYQTGQFKQITAQLKSGKSSYSDKKEILNLLKGKAHTEVLELIGLLLSDNKQPSNFIEQLLALIDLIKRALPAAKQRTLIKEQLTELTRLLKKLSSYVKYNAHQMSLQAFRIILVQLMKSCEISLKGEPLQGIQIMGMLETRNLDFKNIIIVSANEGILPRAENMDSFIPFDIRAYYKLTLPKDKTDVYSYYFYRLLQGASQVTLLYNTEPNVLGGGEKSRYLIQLKDELLPLNKRIIYTESIVHIPLNNKMGSQHISIEKSQDVMNKLEALAESGFSASSLNSYVNCKLQFYFSRILKLKTTPNAQHAIEANIFGKIVHAVLEDLYKPFLNNTIAADVLSDSIKQLHFDMQKYFLEYLHAGDLQNGKNLLILNVAEQYVRQFVKADVSYLKKQRRSLVGVEQELTSTIQLEDRLIHLKGIIDRLDKDEASGGIRIVDYKTGKVAPNDLVLKDWGDLLNTDKQNKTFQVLFYAYLYDQAGQTTTEIETGIYSLRSFTNGFMTPALPEKLSLREGLYHFEIQLKALLSDLFDPDSDFDQTKQALTCNYCDYKNICNR